MRDAPAVEGGEGAAFAGEVMRPANLSRGWTLSWAPRGGSLWLGADEALCVGDESLYPGGDCARLLLEIPTHRGYLTAHSAPVLMHGPLDQTPTLPQLALYPRTRSPNLTFESIAGGGAATLVALELTLEGAAGAVLGREALHG